MPPTTARLTQNLPDGGRLEGRFLRGRLEGLGTWYSPDGSSLRGRFRRGLPHGVTTQTMPDGCTLTATHRRGVLHGRVEERDADGDLLFEASYVAGAVSGHCRRFLPDGGRLEAWVAASDAPCDDPDGASDHEDDEETTDDEEEEEEEGEEGGEESEAGETSTPNDPADGNRYADGDGGRSAALVSNTAPVASTDAVHSQDFADSAEGSHGRGDSESECGSDTGVDDPFSGPQVAYIYPDAATALLGRFTNSLAACAHVGTAEEAAQLTSVPLETLVPALGTHPCGCVRLGAATPIVRGQAPDARSAGVDLLLPDSYEAVRVRAARSTVADGGEGLFACRALAAGELASFYSGVRLTHAEVDSRDWAANDNTITLDNDTVIDVPPELSSVNVYCATLGHKANHSFENPNAEYDVCFHPRFGIIKAIRTLQPVAAGEELFVTYGYEIGALLYEHGLTEIPTDEAVDAPPWFITKARAHLRATAPPTTKRHKG